MTRLLLLAALFVIGLATGLLGAFVQASRLVTTWPWGQLVVPWGVALVVLLLLVLIRGGAWLLRSRLWAPSSCQLHPHRVIFCSLAEPGSGFTY